jgi:pyruvate,water dikinase
MDAAGLSEEARRVSAAADKMALEDIKSETQT